MKRKCKRRIKRSKDGNSLALLFHDNKIKMVKKSPWKKQKENPIGYPGEGKRWKGNITEEPIEGKTGTVLYFSMEMYLNGIKEFRKRKSISLRECIQLTVCWQTNRKTATTIRTWFIPNKAHSSKSFDTKWNPVCCKTNRKMQLWLSICWQTNRKIASTIRNRFTPTRYTLPNDLIPNATPFFAKPIGKCNYTSPFVDKPIGKCNYTSPFVDKPIGKLQLQSEQRFIGTVDSRHYGIKFIINSLWN